MRKQFNVEHLTHALWQAESNLRHGIRDLEVIFDNLNQAEMSDEYFAARSFCLELERFITNARTKIKRLSDKDRY